MRAGGDDEVEGWQKAVATATEGGGDEVAKAAMRVATPTNPNPNQSVERRLQPPILSSVSIDGTRPANIPFLPCDPSGFWPLNWTL